MCECKIQVKNCDIQEWNEVLSNENNTGIPHDDMDPNGGPYIFIVSMKNRNIWICRVQDDNATNSTDRPQNAYISIKRELKIRARNRLSIAIIQSRILKSFDRTIKRNCVEKHIIREKVNGKRSRGRSPIRYIRTRLIPSEKAQCQKASGIRRIESPGVTFPIGIT